MERPMPRSANACPAVEHDPRQVRHRLDVVDDGRRLVEAHDGRKPRRLVARVPPLALEALEEGRLLATDVGAGPRVDDEVDREARAQDVAADRPEGVRLVEGGGHALEPEGELTAHEDEGLRGTDGVGADEDALDDLVRVLLHQHVVLEGAGLALVAVDDEVDGLGLPEHPPLLAGLEAGAAPPEEVGGEHLLGDRRRLHGEGLAQAVVAAGVEICLQRPGLGLADPAGDPGGDDPREPDVR